MNYYIDAIKNYAIFSGRTTRKEFWMFYLFNFIAVFLVSIIASILISATDMSGFAFLISIYGLFIFLPAISCAIRRLHDINKAGVWLLVGFIPLIGGIWLIILLATETVNEGNSF